MASGPRFGKIAAIGLGCFLALGVVTALLRLQERQCAPPSSSRSEPAAVSPTVYLPSTRRCLVHGSRRGALAKLLEDAGGLGDAFLQEQLTTASHPSSANEEC